VSDSVSPLREENPELLEDEEDEIDELGGELTDGSAVGKSGVLVDSQAE
jgi:hypothetical protein